MKSNTFINSGAGHGDNIGSIITMLIDDQGADLDQILTDNRDTRHRSDNNLQVAEIKEEGCTGVNDHLGVGLSSDYPRQYQSSISGSPDYYYQRDYVTSISQEHCSDRDIETRSSLSSNSEGDESDMCRYNRGYQSGGGMMTSSSMINTAVSPYMIRDTGQPLAQTNMKKDDKYWERRRKNNLAAKKSRDARRVRENQLRLRVLCLENANRVLREQMDRKDVELTQLRERLSKYETVSPIQHTSDHQTMLNMQT